MKAVQYASPKKVAAVVWHYFTRPGRVNFTPPQEALIARAEKGEMYYRGDRIVTYRWGKGEHRVLLVHGWRSKVADFRRMIEALTAAGYEVHGFDLRAHGHSEGKHTAVPEYRDMIRNYIFKTGKFHAVLGYSVGGISAGITLAEMSPEWQPKVFFIVAAPPYIRYFFKDIVREAGLNDAVYEKMAGMVKEIYREDIDYFDLRNKNTALKEIEKHLIYCENDETIPFEKGQELVKAWVDSHFVHASGFGHYKIISREEIIRYVINQLG
jgi:esterase/lipase